MFWQIWLDVFDVLTKYGGQFDFLTNYGGLFFDVFTNMMDVFDVLQICWTFFTFCSNMVDVLTEAGGSELISHVCVQAAFVGRLVQCKNMPVKSCTEFCINYLCT